MVKTLSRPVAQEPDLAQLDACRQIIGQHCYSTQSTISRLLRRLGVAKAQNANGKKVYTLVDEQLEPAGSTRSIHDMVREVVHNQQMVLIHTTPGAATVVARLLDRNANPEIMGAVAGNDVVLVAPRHISRTRQAHAAVVRSLAQAR